MGVDREPIPVQVCVATMRAEDGAGRKTKYAGDHVVDGVDLVDFRPLVRDEVGGKSEAQLPVGPVDFLRVALRTSGMHMDTSVGRTACRVIDSRDGSPKGDASGKMRQVEVQCGGFGNGPIMCRNAHRRRHAVFRRRVCMMCETPVAIAAVAALPDLNDFALHGFLSQEWMLIPITVSRYALAVVPDSKLNRILVNPRWLEPLRCMMAQDYDYKENIVIVITCFVFDRSANLWLSCRSQAAGRRNPQHRLFVKVRRRQHPR